MDKSIQLKIYKEIIRKELSVRKTEILVRKLKENRKPVKTLKKRNTFQKEEEYFSKLIGSRIEIVTLGDHKGILKISFNSKSELSKLKRIFKK